MKKKQNMLNNMLSEKNKIQTHNVIISVQLSIYGRICLQQDCIGSHRESYEGVCSKRDAINQMQRSKERNIIRPSGV